MRSKRSLAAMASAVLLLGNLANVAPAAAAPTTVEYPSGSGACDSSHTLQECIDSVDPGSTVILTSEVIEDGNATVAIDKSLVLRGVDRSLLPQLLGVSIGSTSSTIEVTVQDIKVSFLAQVNLLGGSGHKVTLRRLQVGKGSTNAQGVEVTASAGASVTIQNSYIRSTDNQDEQLSLFADHPTGTIDFRVVGNRITGRGNPDSGAGIRLAMEGPGTVRTVIANNVIWDVSRCNCGAAAGIAVLPDGPIQASVDIAGNTVERSQSNGIQQRNDITGGGRLTLDVFDNIFSHHPNGALSLERGASGSVRFRAGYNAYFRNGSSGMDGFSRGSHNQSADPRFVDRAHGDLRLRSSSPLIDKGQICSPAGVALPDAAGKHRLAGPSVDLGAYERGAGSASGVVRVGTSGKDSLFGSSGRDILCGFAGNDSLCTKDGKGGDYVDGGSGRDKARTDSTDRRRSIEASGPCAL